MPDDDYASFPNWEFATAGPLRERLNGLALAGRKTATFSLVVLNDMFPEDTPTPGNVFVMRSTNGAGIALIESVAYLTLPISEVTWGQVESEGESFRSVEHWRQAHEHFWAQFNEAIRTHTKNPNWAVADDTLVTYETFRVVRKLPGADAARFPVVELTVAPDDLEMASSELYDLGTIGIEELTSDDLTTPRRADAVPKHAIGLRAGFASDEAAAEAESALDAAWQPRFEVLLGDDWLDAWREHFEPTRLGRFMILPGWWSDASLAPHTSLNSGLLPLVIDPGRSFGTGAHSTTALSLAALELLVSGGQTVLDVGCGSGVLSVAAALLGASSVVGIDIETAAVDNTVSNAGRNGVGAIVTAKADPIDTVSETFDIVVANILAPVLIDLAAAISRRVASGGFAVLAGLIDEQQASVVDAYTACGLVMVDVSREGNWVGLTLQRP